MKNKKIHIIFVFTGFLSIVGLIALTDLDPKIIEEKFIYNEFDGGVISKKVNDLIIHKVDQQGNVWASAGYSLYKKQPGIRKYMRVARLPIPPAIEYLGYFKSLRKLFNIEELTEFMITKKGTLIVFAAGYVFRSDDSGRTFQRVHKIEKFGRGVGRGVMPQGYTQNLKGTIYWGEYFRNPQREKVKIWMSKDDGLTWQVAHQFNDGEIRHIHSVQYDHYSNKVWITTGDSDHESSIGFLDEDNVYKKIGSGSQKWRAVSLLFTNNYVIWGTDGVSDDYPKNQIWRWDRKKDKTFLSTDIDSDAFYSAGGKDCMVITTDGKGNGGTLWISNDGTQWIDAISWEEYKPDRHGTIRTIFVNDCTFYFTKINLNNYSVLTLKAQLN